MMECDLKWKCRVLRVHLCLCVSVFLSVRMRVFTACMTTLWSWVRTHRPTGSQQMVEVGVLENTNIKVRFDSLCDSTG